MKTTKAHFKTFKKEAQKWIEILSLIDYDVDFYHEEGGEELASCSSYPDARCARIDLNATWPDEIEITDRAIRMAAFHEVCELRFSALCTLAKDRYASEIGIDAEKHAIIRVLENRWFKKCK